VCGSELLSKLDSELGDLFKLSVADAIAVQRQSVIAQERQWVSNVRNACGDEPCLQDAYLKRIEALSLVSDGNGNQGKYVVDPDKISHQVTEFQKELQQMSVSASLTDCSPMILLTLNSGLPVTRGSLPEAVYSASCKLQGHPIMICSNSLTGHLTVRFEGVAYGKPLVSFADSNCPYGG